MSARLFDPRRKDGTFPFEYTLPVNQDVRATWDKICPGWRARKCENSKPATVREIKPRVRGKA